MRRDTGKSPGDFNKGLAIMVGWGRKGDESNGKLTQIWEGDMIVSRIA